jgi:hypothetical protein
MDVPAPLTWSSFSQKLCGLLWWLIERSIKGWKTTALGAASIGTFLAEHYTQSAGTPVHRDPVFWAALSTAVTLALKSDGKR